MLICIQHVRPEALIPDIISTVSEGAKAGGENLQELEQCGNFRFIRIGSVLLYRAAVASSVLLGHLQVHFSVSEAIFGGAVLGHGVAVACVAVHADPLALQHLVSVHRCTEIRVSGLELAMEADDGHGVGGVAVVAADGPVSALAHAVAHFGQVQLVQQVLVETRVFVDSVVLTVAVAGGVGGAVAELNVHRFGC